MREFTEAWGRSEKTPLWLMAGGAALLTVAGIASPPDSALMVAGGVVSGVILVARPDIAFALIFGIESLFTEDVLLVNEQLEQTIYKISLPYLGLNIFEAALLLLALITFCSSGEWYMAPGSISRWPGLERPAWWDISPA